jgi:hypothetical protein
VIEIAIMLWCASPYNRRGPDARTGACLGLRGRFVRGDRLEVRRGPLIVGSQHRQVVNHAVRSRAVAIRMLDLDGREVHSAAC